MKNYLLLQIFVVFLICNTKLAVGQSSWERELGQNRSFIKNKGQFDDRLKSSDDEIHYAHDGGNHNYYFTKSGVIFELSHKDKRGRSKAEKEYRKSRKAEGFNNNEDWQKFQEADFYNRLVETRDELTAFWVGANPNVRIIAENEDSFYHSYTIYNSNRELININKIPSFQKLIYKDLYPNIDVVYEFHPEIGIKYSVVLHPGSDPSVVKLSYSKDIQMQSDGTIRTSTVLGDIIDHAPLTFYEGNVSDVIHSQYRIMGNVISFELSDYNRMRTVVIDPWTQTPNFNTNWKCIWECERDGAGNVYIIGGIMPLQLLKYDQAGTLQWTYNTPYDTTMWLGTFATDIAGNSYVSNGSTARIQKVSPAGGLVWNNANPGGLFTSTEFWNITFNCDQTRLVIGGTGGTVPPVPYIYEMNMNNGNVVTSVQLHGSAGGLFDPQEVRAIAPSENGRYYFLTHDSIGYVHNDLNACGAAGASSVLFDNGSTLSYKCENYRYDNSGIMALAHYDGFIYVNRGNQLQKRDFYTSNIVSTVAIPGGIYNTTTVPFLGTSSQVGNSGIDIDDCGNIYVGSANGVYKFDQNLNQIASFPTTYNVYDVHVSLNGDVIACGSTGTSSSNSRTGTIQSFAATACAPKSIECCDVAVCPVDPLCITDSPVTLISISSSGGTWSGTGVDAAGVFDPAVAGVGTHTITYTLPCGSESIDIVVDECPELNICIDQNGDLVASGGDGNYNWETGVETPVTYPINSEQECIDCPSTTPQYIPIFGFYDGCSSNTCNDIDTVWTSVGVGTSYTPTTFPLMVTDGNGVFTVISSLADLSPCSTDPPCPQINVAISNQSDVSCNGANDGAATVSATGGSGPYTYTWTPGNITGATQTGLSPQTYTVSVEDANNCPGSVQVTIAEPSALSANAVATDACDNTGTASASPSGGTGPYTYSWSTGETTSSISNLAPGGYTVTVTDANSCTVQQTVTVSCTGCPTITVTESSHTDVTCNGANDGAATVVASGGNAPYSYTWNPGGMTGGSQTGLSPQTYTIVAEDTDGCTGTIQVVITESIVMTAITSSVDASCGINDGQATVNVSGGTGPYSYVWTPNVGTTASVSGLSAGVYSVVVTDANGCQLTETINVNNQNAPTATITSVSDETCLGAANGSATVSATGGSGNYTYAWSPSGGTSATATGLATGTYTVTVTDDSGCITSINVTIGAGSVITVTASVTDEDCGVANGAIDLSVSGGSGNYTYVWSSGEVTQDISGVSTGEYEVIVTDDTGCSTTETITVGVIGELFVTVVPPVATIDAGESVQLEASGGYTYTWTPEEGLSCTDCPDPIASPMVTTTYVVTAIDENGCAGDTTVVIFVENVCGEIFVPTIFSPNDDGNNDEHCVMGDCVQEFELSIYNRWGERVFISDNQANCWDGIFRGKPVQTGVYVYKLRIRLVDGTEVIDSGNINVVR